MSREMIDSECKQVKQIPCDWQCCQFKFLLKNNDGGVWGNDPTGENDTIVLRSTEQTLNGTWNINKPALRDLSGIDISGKMLLANDLLMTKSSGSSLHIGKTTLVDKKIEDMHCTWSNFMQRLRMNAQAIIPRYAWYFINSSCAREQFVYMQNSTVGLGNINSADIDALVVSFPDMPEQRQIVSFLDRKCSAIDTAIEKTKKSIEKLEEYKKAVITKAVTKHEGWTECKLRFVANIVRGGSPRPIDAYITDGEGLNWVKIGDATGNGKYINNTKQKITKDGLNKTRLVPAGTLLLTNSMSFGHPYVLNIEGCIHDGWLAFFDFEKVTQDYLYYFLESDVAMEQFSRSVEGSVVNNLNIDKVKSSYIAFPSITEQNLIVERLDRLCIAINAVIEKKKKAIEKWEEYKKSLIYYAVTGKIDCRNEVIE